MKIKQLIIDFFIFCFLFQTTFAEVEETITFIKTVVEYVTIAKDALSLGNEVKTALGKIENFKEFIDNLDPNSQHQKTIEKKIEKIHSSVAIIKDKIEHLEFSVDLKHFNSHIKYPTKHVYNAFQKFIELPTNSTMSSLNSQCQNHPPNIILETMGDILSENWLIDQAQFNKYDSREFFKNIHKIDHIVESLVIAQAACSSLHGVDDAKYEFKKLKQNILMIRGHVEHSKQIIHNFAFNYSKTYVEEYLSAYSNDKKSKGQKNAEIASHLMKHFMTKFNYGMFYTFSVSHDQKSNFHVGNFPDTAAYNVHTNGINVFVMRASEECKEIPKDIKDALGWTCLGKNELINYLKHKCGTKLLCAFKSATTLCGNNWFTSILHWDGDTCLDVYASNGGICGISNSCLDRKIIASYFPSNFTSKTLSIDKFFLAKTHNLEYIDQNFNSDEKYSNIKGIISIPFEYIKEKLFINQDFGDQLNSLLKHFISHTMITTSTDISDAKNFNITDSNTNLSYLFANSSSIMNFEWSMHFLLVIFLIFW